MIGAAKTNTQSKIANTVKTIILLMQLKSLLSVPAVTSFQLLRIIKFILIFLYMELLSFPWHGMA